MPTWKPKRCRYCGTTTGEGAVISNRGICSDCAIARQAVAVAGMADKNSDTYKRWAESMRRHLDATAPQGVAAPPPRGRQKSSS